MKKIVLFSAVAAAFAAVACSSNNELVINGNIDSGAENAYVVADGDTLATVPVVDGNFSVKVPLSETMAVIYVRDLPGTSFATVIAEPGTVNYVKNGNAVKVTGTPVNDIYQEYRDKMIEFNDAYRAAETREAKNAIAAEADELDKKLYEDNLDNYLSVIQLQSMQYDMDGYALEEALAKVNPKFAATKVVTNLRDRAEILKKSAVGQPYLEINLPDAEGNALPLSSVVGEGKWVLLDFWASWCGPCMGEVPYLVSAYGEYHPKGFEIYGVSLDRDREPWLKAIEDNKMNWIHVSDIKMWQCEAAATYGVNAIPANFLIGPDGKIAARNLRGESLAAKLSEIFD